MKITEVKTSDFTPAPKPTIGSKICDLNLRVAKAAITAFVAISCYGAIVGCVAGCLFMGATISFTAAQVSYNSMVNALGNGILSSINNPFKFYSQVYDYLWNKNKAKSPTAPPAPDVNGVDAPVPQNNAAPIPQTIIVHNHYSRPPTEKRRGFMAKFQRVSYDLRHKFNENLSKSRSPRKNRFSFMQAKIRAAAMVPMVVSPFNPTF